MFLFVTLCRYHNNICRHKASCLALATIMTLILAWWVKTSFDRRKWKYKRPITKSWHPGNWNSKPYGKRMSFWSLHWQSTCLDARYSFVPFHWLRQGLFRDVASSASSSFGVPCLQVPRTPHAASLPHPPKNMMDRGWGLLHEMYWDWGEAEAEGLLAEAEAWAEGVEGAEGWLDWGEAEAEGLLAETEAWAEGVEGAEGWLDWGEAEAEGLLAETEAWAEGAEGWLDWGEAEAEGLLAETEAWAEVEVWLDWGEAGECLDLKAKVVVVLILVLLVDYCIWCISTCGARDCHFCWSSGCIVDTGTCCLCVWPGNDCAERHMTDMSFGTLHIYILLSLIFRTTGSSSRGVLFRNGSVPAYCLYGWMPFRTLHKGTWSGI